MKITYFTDTDTAWFQFTDGEADETVQVSDNVFLDFDTEGNLVTLTLATVGDTDLNKLTLATFTPGTDLKQFARSDDGKKTVDLNFIPGK